MFLLFSGRTYYAAGGWRDYVGSYFTLEDAILDGDALLEETEISYGDDWYHVVDLEKDEIVYYRGEAYCV